MWRAATSPFLPACLAGLALALAGPPGAQAESEALRVCADPNNLPYSNAAGEGFENALAEILAAELGLQVEYAWWPQRRGFIRNTLNAGTCDVVMGVPAGYAMTATTAPYYRSSYVTVTRASEGLDIEELRDPRLRELRIGIHTIGDDYSNPPPAQVLARLGIRDKVQGYSIYGDYSTPNPPRLLIEAVAKGEIDVAIAWGPIAGYFARLQETALAVQPVQDAFPQLPMAFDIGLGLRRGDSALREALETALARRRGDIEAVLARFGVPRLPLEGGEAGQAGAEPEEEAR